MIGFSAPIADTDGALVVNEDKAQTRLSNPAARVSRKKTLDGGVYIDHSGVSDGDRTFVIALPEVTEAQYTIIKRLYRNYTSITIACREGVFKGTIERIRFSGARLDVTILIEEKLSE